jgi:hypothetical protein
MYINLYYFPSTGPSDDVQSLRHINLAEPPDKRRGFNSAGIYVFYIIYKYAKHIY